MTIEKNILFAERVPSGDRWRIINGENIYNSLTETLEAWYQECITKPQAFRLEPLKGKLYYITTQEVEIKEPEPKKYNIYGELE